MLTILQEEQFEDFYQLIEESFPSDEYRSYQKQRALLSHPHYQIYVYEKDYEIAAFFAIWEGPHFISLEHFAVKSSSRNGGLGSKLLQVFLKQQTEPIVIEIERPEGGFEKDEPVFMNEMVLALVSGAMFNQLLQKNKAQFHLY